jgi:hypothetical protein
MVDDGFLIGFEDSSGNFVEVGRFNNTADDVTQPVEIKHASSGERITLDSSGFETRSVTSTDSVTVTDGEATNTLHYGSDQSRGVAGDNSVSIGIRARAGQNNTATLGHKAGETSTSGNLTAIGTLAAQASIGKDITAIGFRSGDNATGKRSTMIGSFAGQFVSAPRATVIGFRAGENLGGSQTTAIGLLAARGDGLSDPSTMGSENIGIGRSAIRNNQASGLIAIGMEAGINAQTDDQLIITDRNGNRRMVMDLTNGNLKIDGTLTENATL